MEHRFRGMLSGCMALGGLGVAQAQLAPDVLQHYGGTYAVACANPQSPRLRVERQALHVEQGSHRLSARREVMSIYSYFGQSAPPGFLVALEGQVQPQMVLTFLVYSDARGQYVTLDGHPKVLSNLGTLAKARFNRCDAAANQRAADAVQQEKQAAASAQAAQASSQARYPSELVRDRRFKAAWLKVLGPLSRERWLAGLEGPAPDLKREKLAGQSWLVATFCKPHDCRDNNAVVAYDETRGVAFGYLHLADRGRFVGQPPAPPGHRAATHLAAAVAPEPLNKLPVSHSPMLH